MIIDAEEKRLISPNKVRLFVYKPTSLELLSS
jgi:hypothetical protein